MPRASRAPIRSSWPLPSTRGPQSDAGRAEYLLLLGLALAASLWIFTRVSFPLLVIAPFLLLCGYRLSPARVGVLVLLVCTVAVVLTLAGIGPISKYPLFERDVRLLVFLITAALLTLPVATLKRRQARTAEALRLREEQYRLLADHSGDLVLRLSASGEADYASNAAQRMLGLSADRLLGNGLAEQIHPGDRAVFAAALKRVRREGDVVASFRMLHAAGTERWIEAHMRCADSPSTSVNRQRNECPVVAVLRDIHDRRRAEQMVVEGAARLRESNRLLMMAEELASLGHWVLDSARGELMLSGEAAAMLGLDDVAVPVRRALDLLRPDDRRQLLRSFVAARAAKTPHECTVRLNDGDLPRTLQLRMQVQGEGEQRDIFGVVSDISARLESDQRLICALDEAQAAANFRSQFLATMSHEIRTPMTGVLGMLELLEADPPEAERRLYLQTMRQSGDLLMMVLNDILDFSKVDAGHLAIAAEPFDLGDTLLSTLRLFDRTASARGLLIRLDAPPPGAMWLSGDALRLRQVLSNLLSNAIKFSERGEVTLRCQAAPAGRDRRRLRISVNDQGIGIPPELRERLFEPFVQGEGSGSGGGTGLGLAISRRLISAMGGSISVRSERDRGSTFTILLTLSTAEAAADRRGDSSPVAAPSLHILLAEDNPVNQLLVTALCKRLGHQVTCADDGEAAVAIAGTRRFDVILMDMQMPRCDGLAAARRIRAGNGPNATVPIVALTADAATSRRPLYAKVGLDALLTKPIDSRDFAATLASLSTGEVRESTDGPPLLAKPTGPVLDHAVLDNVGALLGARRLDQLLDLLLAELDERPADIRSAIADRQFAAAAATAHNLRGAAANLGATAVASAAVAVEQALTQASAGDPRLLAAALRQLAAAVAATRHALEQRRRSPSASAVRA